MDVLNMSYPFSKRVGDNITWMMCFNENGGVVDRFVEEDVYVRNCRFALGRDGIIIL